MKVLQITPIWPSAITVLCRQIVRHNVKKADIKLVTCHPKRPDQREIDQIRTLWKWCDLVDMQYWKSGAKVRELFPDLWPTKKKIISHYNPYNLNEEKWEDYVQSVVVNSYQQSVLPTARMIPLCIDLDFYKFNRSSYTTEPVVNMSVSRIESKKGVIQVAQSCRDLNYKFLLVGRVSDGEYMERVKKAAGPMLEFRNNVSDDEVRKAYHQSAVHVCNSKDHFESGCYDDQTELLTDQGWKLFSQLNKNEKVATLNQTTNQLEYHLPDEYVSQDYSGDLFSTQNRSLDFSVTPNHNMWLSRHTSKNNKTHYEDFGFCRADEVPSGFKIKRTCNWTGETSNNANWFKFLGIYLAEGSLDWGSENYCRIQVAAFKKKEKDAIRDLLDEMKFQYTETRDRFKIRGQNVLAAYLSQFGTALDKYVPKEVLDSTAEMIEHFLQWYHLGDGSLHNGIRHFYTNSKSLADGLQECLIKIGRNGNITVRDHRGDKRLIEGRWITVKNVEYVVAERTKRTDSHVRRSLDYKKRPYRGKVYCVEVKNHILLVRRNGKAMFCGNTMPILESMACGLPVLTRQVGHVADIYDGKNMHILETGHEDVDNIKVQLAHMMNDRRYRISLRNTAVETVQSRSDKWRAGEYLKLYEEVLK